ncbi:class I SAM-dependent methyltransferase [Rhodococcus sp. 14-2470-1b]|uniref:class I SAM-dependent methyltransferase n=1 Tax=Rhodococcus sp. 14-2470-1b TaxID=2023149 RepID=UPI00113FD220|nr:class I SAM-dependent methyltransferase [Rhodococcus sp. 14-2470-1b]
MIGIWQRTQRTPESVIDIGAGVGVFSALASDYWPRAQVHSIDVNPVTLGLMGVHIARSRGLADPLTDDEGIRLILSDYTTWLEEGSDELGGTRLFLGNPPYTRSQLISPTDRPRLAEAAQGLCGRRASLSSFITAMTVLKLRPSDGLCLLLPAQWLESDYALSLRDAIWGLRSRRVELHLVDSWKFADASVDAVALMIGADGQGQTSFSVSRWGSDLPRPISRVGPAPANWRRLFYSFEGATEVAHPTQSVSKRLVLGDFVDVRRGTATGANAFFIVDEQLVRDRGLPSRALSRVVRHLTNATQTITMKNFCRLEKDGDRYILLATARDRADSQALDIYLKEGESEGLDGRLLCSRRKVWFDLHHDVSIPDVIISSMTKGNFKIAVNACEAAITNNLFGWKWKDEVPVKVRIRILSWLRSDDGQIALRRTARQQSDHLFQLSPSALKGLVVPHSVRSGAVSYTLSGIKR